MSSILGLDIGGANIKWANSCGDAASVPFPLWQRPQELAGALREIVSAIPRDSLVVATMTGELADCYAIKAEGVRAIVDALDQTAMGRQVFWYTLEGAFASAGNAYERPLALAAANWHALARFAASLVGENSGLLIDIGSTTTDIIPLVAGMPAARAFTDPQRLSLGELVYSGVERTPVCAIAPTVPWRGKTCRLAGELFATAWDVYLTLNRVVEEPATTNTADGRPATRTCAAARLARSICADTTECGPEDVRTIANALYTAQLETLLQAAREVISHMQQPPGVVVVSGQGEFLARELAEQVTPDADTSSLTERLGPVHSRAAAAYALVEIAQQDGVARCG